MDGEGTKDRYAEQLSCLDQENWEEVDGEEGDSDGLTLLPQLDHDGLMVRHRLTGWMKYWPQEGEEAGEVENGQEGVELDPSRWSRYYRYSGHCYY